MLPRKLRLRVRPSDHIASEDVLPEAVYAHFCLTLEQMSSRKFPGVAVPSAARRYCKGRGSFPGSTRGPHAHV